MIREFTSFSGRAQVLNAIREVQYSDGALTIKGLTAEEAMQLLGGGPAKLVALREAVEAGEKSPPAACSVDSAMEKAAKREEPAAEEKPKRPAARAAKPEPVAGKEESKPEPRKSTPPGPAQQAAVGNILDRAKEAGDQIRRASERPAAPPEKAPEVKITTKAAKSGGLIDPNDIPKEIAEAKNIRAAVLWFTKQDVKDAELITTELQSIASVIPFFSSPNLLARVEAVLDLME